MSQENKPAGAVEQQQHVKPVEDGQEEKIAATNLAESRIWASAIKLIRDGEASLPE